MFVDVYWDRGTRVDPYFLRDIMFVDVYWDRAICVYPHFQKFYRYIVTARIQE